VLCIGSRTGVASTSVALALGVCRCVHALAQQAVCWCAHAKHGKYGLDFSVRELQ
jgi:hypothetical protein